MRASVTCAPIARTVRDIDSEVGVGPSQGLGEHGAINSDNIVTIPKRNLDRSPAGQLDELKQAEVDLALRYALDIRCLAGCQETLTTR